MTPIGCVQHDCEKCKKDEALLRQALEALDAGIAISPNSVLHDKLRERLGGNEMTLPAEHCRCCNARRVLIESLEGQIAHHRAQAQQYRGAMTTLASERAANAALTAEVEKLKATQEQDEALLRQALEALEKAHHSMQTDMSQDVIEDVISAIRKRLGEKT